MWYYSEFGPGLDLVAPSDSLDYRGNIWTTDQTLGRGLNPSRFTCDPQNEDYNCRFGGTSAACPQAAGVAALVLHRRPDLVGNTTMLSRILRLSADRTPYGNPPNDTSRVNNRAGWGRLNAARALLAVVRGDADNSGQISIADAVYLVDYIMSGGAAPIPHYLTGDADCNGSLSIADAVYIINYIYAGGQAPQVCFRY